MLIKRHEVRIVKIELGILRKRDIEQRALSVVVNMSTNQSRQSTEQVATCLHIKTQHIHTVVICQSRAHLHYKQVLIVVAQDGIAV